MCKSPVAAHEALCLSRLFAETILHRPVRKGMTKNAAKHVAKHAAKKMEKPNWRPNLATFLAVFMVAILESSAMSMSAAVQTTFR